MKYTSKQEIFDTAAPALLKQNRHSGTKYNCEYRSEDSLKCAIGHLIPDEMYNPAIEGWGCFASLWEGDSQAKDTIKKLLEDIGLKEHIDFCERLQHIHDDNDPELWKEELIQLAEDYHLEYSCIREL